MLSNATLHHNHRQETHGPGVFRAIGSAPLFSRGPKGPAPKLRLKPMFHEGNLRGLPIHLLVGRLSTLLKNMMVTWDDYF